MSRRAIRLCKASNESVIQKDKAILEQWSCKQITTERMKELIEKNGGKFLTNDEVEITDYLATLGWLRSR